MTLDQLKFNCDTPGITVVQTVRGEIETSNPYSQWNLCDYTGDDALRVLDSRMQFCQQLGIDLDHLVMPRQTHSTNIKVLDNAFLEESIEAQDSELEGVDALVTTLPGVCIGVNTADCVPIVLVDGEAGVIAVAHAGWRGTVGRIASSVVKEMCRQGASVDRIQVAMGPSICQDCFEVGDEVVQAFKNAHFDMDAIVKRNDETGKAHIDLRAANSAVLVAAGISVGNIAVSQHCSRCEHDRFFSARRLGINSGRTFTAILQR